MATLTATPSPAGVGDPISIVGEGFEPSTLCTITCVEEGWQSEITSDASGFFGTDDVADHAIATLTLSGNAVDNETVVIGGRTYRWKNTLAQVDDVKIGASASASLDNLKATLNLTGTVGVEYFTGQTIHATVTAGKKTATTLLMYAKTGGTGGNSLGSTETMTNGSFGGANFAGGTAATGVSAIIFTPDKPGTYDFSATDGTTTATTSVQVFTG